MEFQKLYDLLDSNSMSSFSDYLKNELPIFFSDINHGDYFKWMKYIDELPNITVSKFDFTLDAVTIGDKSDCSIEERAILKNNLMKLKPWRKGPFNIFGLFLDAEWQSNMNDVNGLADIILGKQRHGPTGTVKVEFEGIYTKFKDLSKN